VLIIRRSKLYYTASGIITPVGGHPVHRLREDFTHYTEMDGQQNIKREMALPEMHGQQNIKKEIVLLSSGL
jgi:hypothetical protein